MTVTAGKRLPQILFVSAIILFAAFLRFYRLDRLPPGLHYDEAFKGVEARQILTGTSLPIFFPENFGELPLRTYATALNFALFGDSPWSLRLVSAFAGIIMIAAAYALARALFRSKWTAALAAFILSILYWQLNFSRLGMEPILMPLMLTLSFAFLWYGIRSRQVSGSSAQQWRDGAGWFVLAGVFLGATFYTYQASFFVPVLIAAFAVAELTFNRPFWHSYARSLTLTAIAALLVVAPLGLYFLAHPSEMIQRPSDVTVSSSDTLSLADNALRVAGMFFVRGDTNPRSNLPFRPVLDPFLAIGFVAGLAASLTRVRQPEFRLLLLWLGVMLLPSILTDFAPHFGRTVGAIPALILIVAFGFAWLLERLPVPRRALLGVLVVGLVASAYSTIHDYFGAWASDPGLSDSFDAGYLALARALHDLPPSESIYLSPVGVGHYTIQYGLDGREAHSFDGRQVLVLPPSGAAAAYAIVTREDSQTLAHLQAIFPSGSIADTLPDSSGRPYAVVFRARGAPQLPIYKPIHARLGSSIELVGYDLQRAGGTLVLTVQWKRVAEILESYTVFVHLIGATNPATQLPIWAQEDAQPGRGTYPTCDWQPGETVIDEYRLVLPAEMPSGKYAIEIGMYVNSTGSRLSATDAQGSPLQDNRVLLNGISLP